MFKAAQLLQSYQKKPGALLEEKKCYFPSITLRGNDVEINDLSKARLGASIRDHDVLIEGYKLFRNDPNTNGEGVAIYVTDTLPESKIKHDKKK